MPARHVKRTPIGPVKRGGSAGGPLGFLLIGLICVGVGVGIGHLLFSKKGPEKENGANIQTNEQNNKASSDDFERGEKEGYKKGRKAGHKAGLKAGKDEGRVKGREEGLEEGKKIGEDEGWKDGYAKAKTDYYGPRYEEGLKEGISRGKKFTEPFVIDAGDNVHLSIVNPEKIRWEKVSISVIVEGKAYILHCKNPVEPNTMKIFQYKDFKYGNVPLTKIPEKDVECEIKYSIKVDESAALATKRFDVKMIRGDAKPAPAPEPPK